MDVQTDARPIIVRAEIDKVQEEELARLIGTTRIALKRKRERGVIPPGVYATIDGRIMYSIRRPNWYKSGTVKNPTRGKSLILKGFQHPVAVSL